MMIVLQKIHCIRSFYVRWLQFGTFNPMMRSHGTDVYREIYKFGKKGEPVYDAYREDDRFCVTLCCLIFILLLGR